MVISAALHQLVSDVNRLRDSGERMCSVRLLSGDAVALPEQVAVEFGLKAEASIYHPIGVEQARALIVSVLHRDLAYGGEIMPRDAADALAAHCLQLLPPDQFRFYSNRCPIVEGAWHPATEASFDSGVLAIGEQMACCIWFADED